MEEPSAREERVALSWAALAAVILICWLVQPVAVGIMLGVFLAFMAQRFYERFRKPLGKRWAVVITDVTVALLLIAVIGGLAWVFVAKGEALGTGLVASFEPGGTGAAMVNAVSRFTEHLGLSPAELEQHARAYAESAAVHAAGIAAGIASAAGTMLLGLLFTMLSMHYMLCNWDRVMQRAQDALPLKPEHTVMLLEEFRSIGRTTLLGAIGTGFAQGITATIGYAIASVPEPLFFGAATLIASFVPGVGVLLVVVPVALMLFIQGMPGHAIIELVWSFVVVIGLCDYWVRPRLVRGETEVSTLATFAALFGGLETLGLEGLIVGPVVMSIALAVLRLYTNERRKRISVSAP